ncbi:hypothetical protein VDGL01_06724 [Verticillium dahliae]
MYSDPKTIVSCLRSTCGRPLHSAPNQALTSPFWGQYLVRWRILSMSSWNCAIATSHRSYNWLLRSWRNRHDSTRDIS